MEEAHRFGIVLSGGGARGAYEVGVLAWLLEELPRRLGRPPRIDVFTGTSVGAIHACWLAASLDEPDAGARLVDIWRSLEVAGVYRMGLRDVIAIPRRVLGLGTTGDAGLEADRLAGLLDTRPLERLVRETVPWARLLNTPLVPALRLGCDRLLVIGLRHVPTPAEDAALAPARTANYASLTYLSGKVLNALLLDRVDYDVDRLQLLNALLRAGIRTYGEGFLPHINDTIREVRGAPYRVVDTVYLRPSMDLGVLAAQCYGHQQRPAGVRAWISETVLRYTVQGLVAEADLLSYLLFDHCYASHLITLGRADAARRADELVALFAEG